MARNRLEHPYRDELLEYLREIELQEGDIVRMRDGRDKSWEHRCCVLRKVAPRSFEVLTEDGRVFRRNRRHLLLTSESFSPDMNDSDDEQPTVLEDLNDASTPPCESFDNGQMDQNPIEPESVPEPRRSPERSRQLSGWLTRGYIL